MQLSLRLYYPSDMDLIAIRLYERRKFNRIIKNCINNILSSNETVYKVPKDINKYIRKPQVPLKVNLCLNEEKDKLIIDFLKGIKPSSRSDTIKMMFRMSMDIFPSDLFPLDTILKRSTNIVSVKSGKKNTIKNDKKEIKQKSDKKIISEDSKDIVKKKPEKLVPKVDHNIIDNNSISDPKKDKLISPEKKTDINKMSDTKENDNDAFEMISGLLGY